MIAAYYVSDKGIRDDGKVAVKRERKDLWTSVYTTATINGHQSTPLLGSMDISLHHC